MKQKPELQLEPEPAEPQFKPNKDICQQLMSRYSASTAPQHRHLLATAAAIQSILSAENLPLTPASYFAAAIDNLADSEALDSTAVAALVSLVGIVVALVEEKEIGIDKAHEAVEVLVEVVERKEGLGVASVRGVVKCLGVLVCGFCELEEWDEVKNGFQSLVKFATDKRPKVRRSAQECLEKVFKSVQSSAIIKEASKLVLSLFKTHMPVALKLSDLKSVDGTKDDTLSKPEHLEVLHMLNLMNLTVPHLSSKISSKILSELLKVMSQQYSPLTRHIFKSIETIFDASRDKVIVPQAENIIDSICLYISFEGKNPMDTVITGASLLKLSLDKLQAGQTISWMRNIPKVCGFLAGLLTNDTATASQTSEIIKKIVDQHIDQNLLLMDENRSFKDLHQKHEEAGPVQSICTVFENILTSYDGIPNEHLLGAISALFLKLGKASFVFMKSIVLKLADFMNHAIQNELATCHLRCCIGSAVVAMGPDKILSLIPISINADDFTSINTWLVAILKDNVVGASLDYYLQHIVPLAKSFQEASVKVNKAVTRQDLQTHAQSLWVLLPAFCHCPVDTHINFKSLAELLVAFLKEDSFMHQHICVALQMLVKQNRSVLLSTDNLVASDSSSLVGSALQSRSVPSYSKKDAHKNIKALASCSKELLWALTDLFIDSPPEKRIYMKDAIGCLASITDSSITKKLFIKKFDFRNNEGEFHKEKSPDGELIDKASKKDVLRHVMLELASSFIEGADDDLTDLIYNFIVYVFKATDVTEHCEAYHTLSKILEEHTSFCSSRLTELMDLVIGLKAPTDVMSLRNRFTCFHKLMVQTLQRSLEEEDTKAFHFLNEIIITLKDTKEDSRKVAYDALLSISSSLRSSSPASANVSYPKLISMIMGYLSGSSPHIKSGAVSALSVLVHNDVDISLEVPDLVSSILSLLKTKAVEVTKAALGFVKVLVSSLPAKDIRNLLSDIMDGILPLSSVSRFHFRSKVIVILEIMIRKCSFAVIELNIPERFKSFVKTVSQNRHHRSTSGEAGTIETETQRLSTKRSEKQKQKKLETVPEGKDPSNLGKRKRKKKEHGEPCNLNESRVGGGFGRSKKARISKDEKPRKNQDKHVNRRTFNKETKSGGGDMRMQKQIGKREKVAFKRPKSASKFQRDGKKQKR